MTGSLLWYTTRGAGAVSLCLLSAVLALGLLAAAGWPRAGWPRFVATALHRNLALLAVVFLVIHVVTAVVDPFTSLGWGAAVIPWGASYRPLWLGLGVLALYLVAALVATSLLRRALGYPAWRFVHWIAYAAWPLALVHSLGAGSDTRFLWMDVVYTVCCAPIALCFAARLRARRATGRQERLPDAPDGPPRWTRLGGEEGR